MLLRVVGIVLVGGGNRPLLQFFGSLQFGKRRTFFDIELDISLEHAVIVVVAIHLQQIKLEFQFRKVVAEVLVCTAFPQVVVNACVGEDDDGVADGLHLMDLVECLIA